MTKLKDFPKALITRLYTSFVIGISCLALSVIGFVISDDKILLYLGIIVFLQSTIQGFITYRIIIRGDYCIYTGVCTSLTQKPFSKYKKCKFIEENGVENILLLDKKTKIFEGHKYIFYFKNNKNLSLGNDYLDVSLSSNNMLGFEDLGE